MVWSSLALECFFLELVEVVRTSRHHSVGERPNGQAATLLGRRQEQHQVSISFPFTSTASTWHQSAAMECLGRWLGAEWKLHSGIDITSLTLVHKERRRCQVPSSLLEWDSRWPLILKEIQEADADLVCLQEVNKYGKSDA